MRRTGRFNPMDQLGPCRVALQEAIQEAETMRQSLVPIRDHIEWVILESKASLDVRAAMVGVRTMLLDAGLWRDAKPIDGGEPKGGA